MTVEKPDPTLQPKWARGALAEVIVQSRPFTCEIPEVQVSVIRSTGSLIVHGGYTHGFLKALSRAMLHDDLRDAFIPSELSLDDPWAEEFNERMDHLDASFIQAEMATTFGAEGWDYIVTSDSVEGVTAKSRHRGVSSAWVAIMLHLRQRTPGLQVHLRATGGKPEPAAMGESTVVSAAAGSGSLDERLARLEQQVSALINILVERRVPNPEQQRIAVIPANAAGARHARESRAAKRAGMELDAFRSQYPGLDRWPPPPDWKL
jgi:hypothetical protein